MVSGPCADPAAVEAFTISILRINSDRLRTTTGPGAGFVYDMFKILVHDQSEEQDYCLRQKTNSSQRNRNTGRSYVYNTSM